MTPPSPTTGSQNSNPGITQELADISQEKISGVLNPLRRLKQFLRDARQVVREDGFKALVKKYGWKLLAVFFFYYLIRDTILYIVIPYLVVSGIMR